MNNETSGKYKKISDIKKAAEEEVDESEKDPLDPYSELVPPKETPMKKVFVWDPIQQAYNLGTYQKGDSLLEFEEI